MKINIEIKLSDDEIKLLRKYDFSEHVSIFDILDDENSVVDRLIDYGILCKYHIDNEIYGTNIYENVIKQMDLLDNSRDLLAQKISYSDYNHLILNSDNLGFLEKKTINLLFEFEKLPKPFGDLN